MSTLAPTRRLARLLPALALGALGACGGGTDPAPVQAAGEPARSWPAGTVLAVEDLPILADEVDAASIWIERIDRKASPDQLRRLALTNVVLPRKLAQLLAPVERERAQAEAREALEHLRAGTYVSVPGPEGTLGQRVGGSFKVVGVPAWGTALDLAPDQWSEPIEELGRFLLIRRVGLKPAAIPLGTEVELDVLAFDFVDPDLVAAEVEAAYDRFHLTIVDPAWRPLVPELLQYRMGVHGP